MSMRSVFLVWRELDPLLATLRARFPDVTFEGAATADGFPDRRVECEALLSFELRPGWLARLPRLRWVQSIGAGVDRLVGVPGLPPAVTITRTRADFGRQIAEHCLGALLHHCGGWPRWAGQQAARVWERGPRSLLLARRAGVLGLGGVGGEVASLLQAVGLEVWGLSAGGRPHPACARVFGAGGMEEFLSGPDFVVIALPLTAATRGLLDAPRLAWLRHGSVLVNVARADIVDETELARALDEHRIAAAYLDVLWQEPLPADSPWWSRENVFVTPHLAGVTETGALADEFGDNLRRYLAGEPLHQVVDRVRGY